MSQLDPSVLFGREHAENYETRFEKMAPLRDTMQLLGRAALRSLPDNARILCVGAGTGLEMRDLAQAYPGWRFTAVDPAPAMLEKCAQAVTAAGLEARCTLHTGYLDSLPDADGLDFDGATSLLVSHFILDREARRAYFAEIARRLKPGARLVVADLASDPDGADHEAVVTVWCDMMGFDEAKKAEYLDMVSHGVSLLAPEDVAEIIQSAGFERPVHVFQGGLIHGWVARRA